MQRKKWPVTFSVGVATFLTPPPSVDDMIKVVDDLMYEAKNSGKDQIKYAVIDQGMKREFRPDNTREFYDRFGSKQDLQGFYENPALDDLTGHADFDHAHHIFEFGFGTGRFAQRLLSRCMEQKNNFFPSASPPKSSSHRREP